MGAHGYVHADLVQFQPGEVIFEAGAGPESTVYLEQVAITARGVELVSVDARDGLDAEQYLREWTRPPRIRFAYLDSWDWPYDGMSQSEQAAQAAWYHERGMDYSQDASAAHHLALAKLLVPLMSDSAWIVIDDTWPTPAGWAGKGRDAVPYLLATGWWYQGGHLDVGAQTTGRNAFYAVVRG